MEKHVNNYKTQIIINLILNGETCNWWFQVPILFLEIGLMKEILIHKVDLDETQK